MIIIRSLFYQVTISDNDSYGIYTIDYDLDEDGNVVPSGLDTYQYGDIVIQTSAVRFIFKRVYAAFDYAVRIMEEIKEHCQEPVIYINMEDLNENWEYHGGELVVEPVK